MQDLNKQQYEAVVYDDGPSLVIAGAGSGKTRVLTNKIMYLINNGYDARRILSLTFTNKAAREMRERISMLVGAESASRLWMGTFHSMFLKILRFNADRIGFRPDFTIYDASDSKSALKHIIKDMKLNDKDYPVNTVASIISSAKNALLSPADYAADLTIAQRDRYKDRPSMSAIYERYQRNCKVSDAMDFDDILYYTNVLFRDNPDVLYKYQNFFQYVLVDEYQDTNFAQHLIVRKLGALHSKICVVGDDAQSIYSFRGANIRNILNLNREFPNLKIFKLEQNYRSTQNILNVANSLIEKNRNQIPKHIFSENAVGSKVQVIESYSDIEESYVVANKISEMKMLQNGEYDDFAVLYRTNAQSRVLEESLRKRNIPYRIYGGLSFYQRKEIRDALAYFRLTVNPNDNEALCRIINYPTRGIGEKTVEKLRQAASKARESIWNVLNGDMSELKFNAGTQRKLALFRSLINGFIELGKTVGASDLAEDIYAKSGIIASLHTESETPENISRLENLEELFNAIKQFVDSKNELGETDNAMSDFLSEVSLATDQDNDAEDDSPKVMLMTVHASKGLEFKNVLIVGVEDELFPSMRATTDHEIEEERRLLYVAITRAKTNCVMTYAKMRYLNGSAHPCTCSRFIDDIDSRLLQLPFGRIQSNSVGFDDTRRTWYSPRKSTERFNKPVTITAKVSVKTTAENQCFSVRRLDELAVGMKVEHQTFGMGVILAVDNSSQDTRITIKFDNMGEKTLLTKYAKLAIL